MLWSHFIYFAFPASVCWAIGALFAYKTQHYRKSIVFTLLGIIIFSVFITGLWVSLERPPMRTMGETRLWYSFFLPIAALITFIRWKFKWILSFSALLSVVFICINLLRPEIHSKALMPALQSVWFVPHVIVYMVAYSIFGVVTVHALYLLIKKPDKDCTSPLPAPQERNMNVKTSSMVLCDNLVYVATAFLTFGMLMGAIWAKEAWGHYWSWDPKETWAAITWVAYIIYIHFRLHRASDWKTTCYLLVFAFILLQICWFGVNYLPAAQGNSVHIYG